MRREEERIRNTLGFLGGQAVRVVGSVWQVLRRSEQKGSPLDNTGYMPAELLRDPFTGAATMELEVIEAQDKSRVSFVWVVVLVASWSITAVAVLKSLGVV